MDPGSFEDDIPPSARLLGGTTARRSLAEDLRSPDPTTSSTALQNPPISRWPMPDAKPSKVSPPDATTPAVPLPLNDEIDGTPPPTSPSVWVRVAGAGTRLMTSMGPERMASPLSLSVLVCTMMTAAQLAPGFSSTRSEPSQTLFRASSKP